LPYAEITEDAFAEKAAATFAVAELTRGMLILRGPCPRCQTQIDIPVVTTLFRSWQGFGGRFRDKGSRNAAADDVEPEPMLCTCDDEHPGRPADRFGCGAYWTLAISKVAS
jgi:hypothetical protein